VAVPPVVAAGAKTKGQNRRPVGSVQGVPISKAEWAKGRSSDAAESKIERFLRERRDKAFTMTEIANDVYGLKYDSLKEVARSVAIQFNVSEALKRLQAEGRVSGKEVRKKVGSGTYYTIV